MSAVSIGLDIAQSVFQVHGIDEMGRTVLRRRLGRSELLVFFAKQPACLITAHTDKAPLPLDFRASRASGSVVEACVSFERFSLRKLRSPLRPGVGGSSWPSLRRKLFMLAHAWISVPSTGKCSSDSSALD